MNKRLITMGLIGGTAIVTGLGLALPELYIGMASMVMGGASLCMALQVYRFCKEKNKQNHARRAKVNQITAT